LCSVVLVTTPTPPVVSVCRSCVSSSTSSVPRPPIPRWCPVRACLFFAFLSINHHTARPAARRGGGRRSGGEVRGGGVSLSPSDVCEAVPACHPPATNTPTGDDGIYSVPAAPCRWRRRSDRVAPAGVVTERAMAPLAGAGSRSGEQVSKAASFDDERSRNPPHHTERPPAS